MESATARVRPSATSGTGRGAVSAATVVALATAAANLLAYGLTVLAARTLPTQEFGAFGALLALVVIGNVVALAVQAVAARTVVQGGRTADGTALLAAGLAGGGTLALAPVLARMLNLPSLSGVLGVGVAVAALAVAAAPMGRAQGAERFARLGVIIAAQAALRVAGGVAGILLVGTAGGALLGVAAGLTVAAGLAYLLMPPVTVERPTRRAGTEVLRAGSALLAVVVLANLDVVLARIVLDPVASGVYAAGSIVTKVAFWLPQFVPLVAFPRLSSPMRRVRALRWSLGVVAASGLVVTAGAAVFAERVVLLLAGPRYLGVAPMLWAFAVLGALLALTQLSAYSAVGRHDRVVSRWLWGGVAVLVVLVLLGSRTVTSVVLTAALVVGLVLVVVATRELRTPPDPAGAVAAGS